MSDLTERRWFSQQEAADYLGVTDRTIRNYVRTGALKGLGFLIYRLLH